MRTPLNLMLIALTWVPCAIAADPVVPDPSTAIADLIPKIRPSVVTIRAYGRDGDELAMGTGFVIDADGLIATNLHVISEGRPFTVELPDHRKLPVLSVESSDRAVDLAIVRVDIQTEPLVALPLSDDDVTQGTQVLAFGNPLGLRDSVVAGIVSAMRDVEGREMIQLAMPVQPGNSGGPLVDMNGKVRGIINMKSAIDDNLGFAIPTARLSQVLAHPNPVTYERWVTLGTIDAQSWTPLFGANWQQRGGIITARGLGSGFGGRSLCLSSAPVTSLPIDIAVDVRFDDDSGAAGLAFHADGKDRHYGFYPSNGRMRLTCFKGPSVYSWEVLAEIPTEHYLPGRWNRLRVRMDSDRLQCFVNGNLVIESSDQQLTSGQVGLVKFRDTSPEFKHFRVGDDLTPEELSDETSQLLQQVLNSSRPFENADARSMQQLGKASELVTRELNRQANQLEEKAKQIRRLAADIALAPILEDLQRLMGQTSEPDERLLRGALMIAKLDNPDIDVEAYLARVQAMADEINHRLAENATSIDRRDALHKYLFEENGFHGGRTEYYHRANSHLDRVIDDREGLPITLSILYLELGRRIGMDVQGIGLPGHFVVRHDVDKDVHQHVDVFERGALLSDQDVKKIVETYAGRVISQDYLREQTTVEILARVVNNLLRVASGNSDLEAIHRYCEALVAIRPDSVDSRLMRSQARAMTKRVKGAVEDLDWLIEQSPPGFGRTEAMQLRDTLMEQGSRE